MPTVAEALQLAVAHHQAGNLNEAERLYLQILQADPRQVDALHLLGMIAEHMGRLDVAAQYIRQALGLRPSFAEAHYHLGNVLRQQGEMIEAAGSYEQALQHKPRFPAAAVNLAKILRLQGKLDEAVECLRRFLRLEPGNADALFHLGATLREQGELIEVIACYHAALRQRPDFAEVHYNLGIVHSESGFMDDAGACYRRALDFRPDYPDALRNLSLALSHQGRVEEAIDCMRRATSLRPDDADVHSGALLLMMYLPGLDPQDVLAEHHRWAERHETPLAAAGKPHANDRGAERILRVGYLSPDFCQHAVANTIEPVLAHHDRSRFHVTCYASVTRPDAITDRMRSLTDSWRDIAKMPDDEVADLIRADRIDILVDLAGHTAGQRLLVFARRPAPVQVAYSGYPATTGMNSIGYRITDRYADPPGQSEAHYTEKLVRMPQNAWCYRPPSSPDVGPLPRRATGFVSFGCLNKLAKLSAPVVALWSRVLWAVPGARLLLLRGASKVAGARLTDEFARHGIGSDRLHFLEPPPSEDQYLGLFRSIDICLDPFPYNGCVTTCNSLWMGVPVIALAGNTYASRQGVSLLSNLDMPNWIAAGPDEYVTLAAHWAEQLTELEILRSGLRGRMRASPLCDEKRFTRNLESAYRGMWMNWCAADSANSF